MVLLCLFPQASTANVVLYRLKAALLYNFAKFVEWPARVDQTPGNSITFCLIGDPNFAQHLRNLTTKQVGSQPIEFRHLGDGETAESCHVLFFGAEDNHLIKSVRRDIQDKPVLQVGHGSRFAEDGGMIGLVRRGRKFAFEVNIEATRHAGLKMSSKLLSLAAYIHGTTSSQ